MPRSTLPEFDPLAELGIGRSPANDPEPPPVARVARKAEQPATDVAEASVVATEPAGAAEPAAEAAVETPASRPETAIEAPKAPARSKPTLSLAASSTAAPRVSKAKTSGRIPADLWEEVRDCVVFHGHTMTIDSFTEQAFREHLKRLRKQHQLGDRFPTREHDPKHGRRVS